MRGHLRKRSKGSWTIYLDIGPDPVTGKGREKGINAKGTTSLIQEGGDTNSACHRQHKLQAQKRRETR